MYLLFIKYDFVNNSFLLDITELLRIKCYATQLTKIFSLFLEEWRGREGVDHEIISGS